MLVTFAACSAPLNKCKTMLVNETIIEQAISQLENDPDLADTLLDEMEDSHPIIMAYLFSESFQVLTQNEREYLIPLALIIYQSYRLIGKPVFELTEEGIGQAEERNCEIYSEHPAKTFRERLNPFFEKAEEEDLLAFLEDALTIDNEAPEEDIELTKEGRDPIFIGLKTLVDVIFSPLAAAS